jgi:hypothetical protein
VNRLASIAAALALTALFTGEAAAQCTKDTDCKGDRICQDGSCVAVAPAPAPVPPPAPPPAPPPVPAQPAPPPEPAGPMKPFQIGYAEVALLVSFLTVGGQTWEIKDWPLENPAFKATTKPLAGVRLAGYAALAESFHLGGYFAIRSGEGRLEPDNNVARTIASGEQKSDMSTWGLGAATKFGGSVSERVWIGGGVDVGLHFLKIDDWDYTDDDTLLGLEIFAKVELDIMLVDTGSFRLALPIAAGAIISPIAVADPNHDDLEIHAVMWHVAPTMMVGLAAGG